MTSHRVRVKDNLVFEIEGNTPEEIRDVIEETAAQADMIWNCDSCGLGVHGDPRFVAISDTDAVMLCLTCAERARAFVRELCHRGLPY